MPVHSEAGRSSHSTDLERRVARNGRLRCRYRSHLCPARALPQTRFQVVELRRSTVGVHFDITVREIPGPPACPNCARGVAGESAVSHALHSA